MTINYETVVYNTGKIGDIGPDSEGSDLVAGFAGPDSYDRRESPLEQGGNNPFDLFKRMENLGDDGFGLDDVRTIGQLYDGGLDSVVDSAKNYVKKGLQEAVLGKLGLGGDTDVPTNASSPAMVGISNQGIVTGARNTPPLVPGDEVFTLNSVSQGTAIADAINAGTQTGGLA